MSRHAQYLASFCSQCIAVGAFVTCQIFRESGTEWKATICLHGKVATSDAKVWCLPSFAAC